MAPSPSPVRRWVRPSPPRISSGVSASRERAGGSLPDPRSSGALDVDRAGPAALIGLELVGDAVVLFQRVQAGLLDRADMDEGILAAILGRDEAVALLGIEE